MDDGSGGTVRVMTWNLWWRFGSWRTRREAILRTLEAERPDVLGLQEVWQSADENLAGWLAERLGMHWAWSRSPVQDRWHSRNGGDPTVDVGVAVLSRFPVLDTAERRLPAGDAPDDGRPPCTRRSTCRAARCRSSPPTSTPPPPSPRSAAPRCGSWPRS